LCKRAVGTNVEISVLCSPEIAAFHDLSQHVGLRIVGEEEAYGFDLLYKPAQPFSMGEVADSSQRALRVVYCFLDTISWDCFYLWCQERDDCWRLASRCSDALFFISPFSEKQFHLRFETDPEVLTRVIPLSLDVRDYLPSTQCRPALETSPASQQKHLLVFGNHYAHKHVQATATSLALAFPDQEIVLFGMEEPVPHGNVRAIFSGRLDEAGLETLYQNSACLIFPSMYEGFGLPVMEGLARGMAVFARETPLNRWIGETCNAGGTLFLYRCDEDLCRGVASFLRQPKSRQTQGAMHSNGRSCEDGVQVIWDCFHELTSRSNLPQFWKRMERIPMPQPKPAALETPAHEPPSPEQKATVQTPALKPGRWSSIRRCPERVHREVLRSLRKIRRWIGGEEPPQSWTS
jgi:hypothetical protein